MAFLRLGGYPIWARARPEATSVNEHGLWRDRREFNATKKALEGLFYTQMGLYRYRGGYYWTDPLVLFPVGIFKELPEDHGVRVHVQDGGQTWVGWRCTVSGFCLGVGGSPDVDARWRYAGAEPPDSFPSAEAPGWKLWQLDDEGYFKGAPEWDAEDAPLPPS